MSKLRRQISANTTNVAETKDLNVIKSKTGNVYESISIIAKRANQINISLNSILCPVAPIKRKAKGYGIKSSSAKQPKTLDSLDHIFFS